MLVRDPAALGYQVQCGYNVCRVGVSVRDFEDLYRCMGVERKGRDKVWGVAGAVGKCKT